MPDNRFQDANRRYHEHVARLFGSKVAHALIGALAGLALAVGVLMQEAKGDATPRGGLFVLAGILFGMIAGIDLHSTRTWKRFGKYTFPVRFILACSAGGAATGVSGALLRIVAPSAIWQYSLGGAALGAGLLIWMKLEGIRAQLTRE